MKSIFNVLSCSRYDFANKDTGEVIKGARLTFLSDVEHDENFSGQKVSEAAAPYEVFTQLKGHLPGNIECEFDIVPKKDGKGRQSASILVKNVIISKAK